MALSKASTKRVAAFVDEFIRSEFVTDYQAETVSNDFSIGGRGEHGCDGSTHYEVINDWRHAFGQWLHNRAHGGCDSFARGDRWNDAVNAHFNHVEEWHLTHGSLHTEIG